MNSVDTSVQSPNNYGNTHPPLYSMISRYRELKELLEDYKRSMLMDGTEVVVGCARYNGIGVTTTDSECPPDYVAVRLPNGNVWFYKLEDVKKLMKSSDVGKIIL